MRRRPVTGPGDASPFAGQHTLHEIDPLTDTAVFRRWVRLDEDHRGEILLTVPRGFWAEWGRPVDLYVAVMVMGSEGEQ